MEERVLKDERDTLGGTALRRRTDDLKHAKHACTNYQCTHKNIPY